MAATGQRFAAPLAAAAIALAGASAARAEEPGPAYLVYAGPYSSSPSSAFGHLFLVLADRPRDPPPLWNVFTFNAVTFDVDPVRYLTVGIAGGFLGKFDRFAFHQKTREYELLDDRDLWLLELRLAPGQRDALEDALHRTEGRWYPYSFFRLNCAHYLQAILAEATGAVPAPSGVVSPAGVFRRVEASPLAGAAFHRRSASRRLSALAEAARPGVVERLGTQDWKAVAADAEWLSTLSRPERVLAQELFAARSLRATSALPDETTAGIARLRLLVLESPPDASAADPDSGPGAEVAPPAFHRYPRLRALWAAPRGSPPRVHLALRGAMHDDADPWLGHPPVSTMELLSIEASSRTDRPDVRLESAVLFSQRALAPSDWARARTSWLLEVVARRGGVLGESAFHLAARGGAGKTVRLGGATWVHGLVTLAAVGATTREGALAPGVEAGLASLVTSRWRLGATWTREHDAFAWSRSAETLRLWTRLDLAPRCGLFAAGDLAPERAVRLGLDVYL